MSIMQTFVNNMFEQILNNVTIECDVKHGGEQMRTRGITNILRTTWILGLCWAVAATASMTEAANEPLQIDVNYLYRASGDKEFRQLKDGGTLRSGDLFKIIFTPKQTCYIYIFQVDSAGQIFSLFPMEEFGGVRLHNVNPVQAGKTYYLPAENKSFQLDDVTGLEQIYFLASRKPDTQLEAQYQQILNFRHQGRGVSKEQLAQLDQLLEDLQNKGQTKGLARIIEDPRVDAEVTWQEDGRQFSVLKQRLEGLCDGCINVIKFEHQ